MAKALWGFSGSFPFPGLPFFVLRTTAGKKVRAVATSFSAFATPFKAWTEISNNISRGFNPFRKAVKMNMILVFKMPPR